jgi:predicted Zn-dependent protease
MPLRVAIGEPKDSPRYGSRAQAREAAIEGIREWQDAAEAQLPWFRIEFVAEDPAADVQILWKRRIPGPWGGFGRLEYRVTEGRLRVGGRMEVAIQPDPFIVLEVPEVRRLIAHEFGHVLGLGHCLDCDSAMNYAWHTRERVLVTEIDVATFVALVSTPNGRRLDGRPMQQLVAMGWKP